MTNGGQRILKHVDEYEETPLKAAVPLNGTPIPEGYYRMVCNQCLKSNGKKGYNTITINLPLGDLSSEQAYQLADVARKYVGDAMRTTVEQNIVLRWVTDEDLPKVYAELKAIGLGAQLAQEPSWTSPPAPEQILVN